MAKSELTEIIPIGSKVWGRRDDGTYCEGKVLRVYYDASRVRVEARDAAAPSDVWVWEGREGTAWHRSDPRGKEDAALAGGRPLPAVHTSDAQIASERVEQAERRAAEAEKILEDKLQLLAAEVSESRTLLIDEAAEEAVALLRDQAARIREQDETIKEERARRAEVEAELKVALSERQVLGTLATDPRGAAHEARANLELTICRFVPPDHRHEVRRACEVAYRAVVAELEHRGKKTLRDLVLDGDVVPSVEIPTVGSTIWGIHPGDDVVHEGEVTNFYCAADLLVVSTMSKEGLSVSRNWFGPRGGQWFREHPTDPEATRSRGDSSPYVVVPGVGATIWGREEDESVHEAVVVDIMCDSGGITMVARDKRDPNTGWVWTGPEGGEWFRSDPRALASGSGAAGEEQGRVG
jgi:hypothetical protein